MILRWWLLSLLSSALAFSSWHLWRHKNGPVPVPLADTETEEFVPALPAPRLAYEPPSRQEPILKPSTTGMATVRGRVLGAQSSRQDTEEELTLVVSNGESETDVTVEADGSFALELAPGRYRFHAELDEMIATLEAVTVSVEDDSEVVLQLSAGATIKGTLRTPSEGKHDGSKAEDISAGFEIRLSGESEWSESQGARIEDNQFTVSGLEAGQRYDLLVTVEGFRPVVLTGITAPSEGHWVNLVKLARLRGGFGIARGQGCPFNEVTIAADNYGTLLIPMDHFCRFQSGDLPPVPRVRVQVSEGDWSFDVLVDIPPHGDPPFLCLHSLCREPAADELSTLEISLVDSPDRMFFASVVHDGFGVSTHAATGEIARTPELPSGATATVSVFARSCRTMNQTLVLAPGINRLSLTCQKR